MFSSKYLFMPGDKVKHVGRSQLFSKVGEVIARVKNTDEYFVVEFGDDTYSVHGASLEKFFYAPGAEPAPKQRHRRDEEDE